MPAQTVSYDLRLASADTVIATRAYSGPSLSVCGSPVLSFKSGSTTLSFLSYSFDSATSEFTFSIPNPSAAVKGTYSVDAVFSAPGSFTWSLGLTLTVTDKCS